MVGVLPDYILSKIPYVIGAIYPIYFIEDSWNVAVISFASVVKLLTGDSIFLFT